MWDVSDLQGRTAHIEIVDEAHLSPRWLLQGIERFVEPPEDVKLPHARKVFPLREGNVLNQVRYEKAKGEIRDKAQELGYLDSDFSVHRIEIFRSELKARIELVLTTGPQYRFGEILFTGVAYFLPDLPRSAFSQFMHLGYHTYVLATQSPDVEATRPLLYATVLVLLALTFALNLVALVIRTRTRRRAAAGH